MTHLLLAIPDWNWNVEPPLTKDHAAQGVRAALDETSIQGADITTLSREHFEDRAYAYFFVSSIGKGPNEHAQFPFTTTDIDKDTFCAKRPDGEYVRQDVQLLWRGYQLAMGVLP